MGERGEAGEVEGMGGEEDGEEGEQHGDAADHGVDEELSGGGGAARASPEPDEEECGDEAELPVEEPVEEVEGGEGAEEAGFEQEDEGEVEGGAVLLVCKEAAMAMGMTMAVSSSIRRPRPSMPRWYSTLRAGIQGWRSWNWRWWRGGRSGTRGRG